MSTRALQKIDLLIADLGKTSQAIDASYHDTTSTTEKVDALQGKLLQIEPVVDSSVASVTTDQQRLRDLQEKAKLLKDEKAHYTESQKELEDLKTYGCCAPVKGTLRNCTMYCCGEMISTISGAVTGGFVFQTTLAAVLGGLGGAVLGCGCLYGCYRVKKFCKG